MSDDQIIREVAEKVMGWKIHARNTAHWTDAEKWNDCDYTFRASVNDWNPLNSWAEAGRVIERMRELGWMLQLETFGNYIHEYS